MAPLLFRELSITPRMMWSIFWVGAASFVPMLFLQYIGEEAVYTIIAQEMAASGEYLSTTLYGQSYGRPGLYSLAILLLSRALGEQYILIAARLITASATLLTALTLAWLIRRIFKDPLFAAFAAAVFLSGDVLLRRGWLAYSDPMFAFFVFGAMACLWVAVEEKRYLFLVLAALGLIGSFLTKVPTGFLYYGILLVVLLWRHPNRAFVFTGWSIFIHLCAIAFPLFWNYGIAAGSVFQTVSEQALLGVRVSGAHGLTYFVERFCSYPLRQIWHLMPISAIVLYCLWSRRLPDASLRQNSLIIAAATAVINLLPYWLFPASRTRYILPIYPLLALCMSYVVLHSGRFVSDLSVKALMGTVGVAFICALVGYPLYQHYFRPNYDHAAEAIISRAGSGPIFATDHTAVGLGIVAELNRRRRSKPPVTIPPGQFTAGFVLAEKPDPSVGAVDTILILGRKSRYLLCRGENCAPKGQESITP
jgi:4-amino-4-deoxy-L-arabinose transferase-like glycosyltransferase